ncbi:hypothetical protein EV193_101331 [Herbihabitans rhizosphaerae]|uniref:Uncharacterized protein n=1 Tax=Herbihabitans rhizosphaerae TaxID=1872711 RepID=A0A4Q7L562_9PSEU|nr:hypothetical protein [Herbihabitans rhizosphaerae]RZS44455.1 hypothetical protein EV193_101331 [Herbihabitans rhizosphaerae]
MATTGQIAPPPRNGEREAAWQLHVELATRITVVALPDDSGTLIEALRSVDAVSLRLAEIAGDYLVPGPTGEPDDVLSIIAEVGDTLDGFTLTWAGPLRAWHAVRAGQDMAGHERAWPDAVRMRSDLAAVQSRLTVLANRLADIGDFASLVRGEHA